jgi:ABC-2 type transport system permease protein
MAKSSVATTPLAPLLPMFGRQFQSELLRLWRTPSFIVSSLALPVILFSFIGLRNIQGGKIDGVSFHVYVLASVATYGIVSVMLYSFGVSVANERGQRLNVLMRATPLPAAIYLLAKVVTALLSALLMLVLLGGFALLLGGVQLSIAAWLSLLAYLLLGSLPFIALGFAIGYTANPSAVAPITNVSFLIFSFASGIFVPLSQLPDFIQNIAPYLPLYRLAQLAWNVVGVQSGSLGEAVLILILYGVVFLGLAILAYRVDEQRSFG